MRGTCPNKGPTLIRRQFIACQSEPGGGAGGGGGGRGGALWKINTGRLDHPSNLIRVFVVGSMDDYYPKHLFFFSCGQRLLYIVCLFLLRFYGPVNAMGSCRARS